MNDNEQDVVNAKILQVKINALAYNLFEVEQQTYPRHETKLHPQSEEHLGVLILYVGVFFPMVEDLFDCC